MKLQPRDYQLAAHEALWQQVHNHPDQNPLVVEATGLGKSLQMAMFIYAMTTTYPHLRSMVVTHVKELVEGNYHTLRALWPAAPVGVYSAGLKMRDTRAQITYAGIASVAKHAALFGRIDFLIVDEAHRISEKENAVYVRFINALREKNPNLIVIGFTATSFRMTTGLLTDGQLFDVECFNIGHGESFIWAIENGYLMRLVPKYPGFQLDDSAIHVTAGDFDNRETSQALRDQNILERAVDTTIALGVEQGRQSWLTFAQSIEDAELIADMFQSKGHDVQAVHSKRNDRDEVLKDFRNGKLRGVTNQNVLTTGFDNPRIDLIAMLRLTRSPGLWVQMLGRGTRPFWVNHMGHNGGPPLYDINTLDGRMASILASPKQNCLVLDFVGNTERLGSINYPNIPRRRGATGVGSPPMRLCPQCATYHHISVRICTECGYEFPPPERIRPEASEAELVVSIDLTQPIPPKEYGVFPVHRMICSHNVGKRGKADTLRVDYFSGVRRFSTWVCFEHPTGSYPLRRAHTWWLNHGGRRGAIPATVDEAMEHASALTKPKFIKVWLNTTYPDIEAYDFVGTAFELPPELGGPPLQEVPPDPTEPKSSDYGNWNPQTDGGYYPGDIPF